MNTKLRLLGVAALLTIGMQYAGVLVGGALLGLPYFLLGLAYVCVAANRGIAGLIRHEAMLRFEREMAQQEKENPSSKSLHQHLAERQGERLARN